MSIHIGAKNGDIAQTVLLPGDPRRARYIAENLLTDSVRYSEVRGMYGYTGNFNGARVSVQGTGMGIPSCSIYINELISEYGVQNLIRVGTCGCLQKDLEIGSVILAMTACTDSNVNRLNFKGMDYAPCASFPLLLRAHDAGKKLGINTSVGNVLSADSFYNDDPDYWKLWADYGVLAIEMETSALYTLAAKHNRNALAVLTVSDNIVTGAAASVEQREQSFMNMIKIALEAVK
jgi:purine-nucleoside phosphorylase